MCRSYCSHRYKELIFVYATKRKSLRIFSYRYLGPLRYFVVVAEVFPVDLYHFKIYVLILYQYGRCMNSYYKITKLEVSETTRFSNESHSTVPCGLTNAHS